MTMHLGPLPLAALVLRPVLVLSRLIIVRENPLLARSVCATSVFLRISLVEHDLDHPGCKLENSIIQQGRKESVWIVKHNFLWYVAGKF